ncbi:hypothetical protein TCAL_06723 [Tigriopus californicus]|uniref:C-type lectin domain-containing protein n=1 Tax=Tigriopus californicus TaxID=6832 RepID=A0A553P4A6_TIGCA|nr:hypothetical protein TCAL_06723 [Tigriopus californicus]
MTRLQAFILVVTLILSFMEHAQGFQSCVEPPNNRDNSREIELQLHCALECEVISNCSSYLFKDWDLYQNHSQTGSNEFPGNCVLLTEFEDNLQYALQSTGSYRLYLKTTYKQSIMFIRFHPKNFEVEHFANWFGYNITLQDPVLNQTLFFKLVDTPLSYDQAERTCAKESGSFPIAYNDAIKQALLTTFGLNQTPLGLRILQNSNAVKESVWSNGHIHWGDSLGSSCADYQHWTQTDWDNNHFVVMDDQGILQPGISNATIFSHFICQFMGLNSMVGGRVATKATDGSYVENDSEHLVDNRWNLNPRFNQWVSGDNSDGNMWLALDFAQSFVVKMMRVQASPSAEAADLVNLKFFVGYNKGDFPQEGTVLNLDDRFGFCGQSAYDLRANNGEILGFTCNHWYIGKFVAVTNGAPQIMAISEVAVFGLPYRGMKV